MRAPFPGTILACALAVCGCERTGGEGLDASLIHTVGRGDLSITVRERGEVKSASDTRITSTLEGRATLIYLIREGTMVAAGDKVAELDVSAIVEKRAQQAIAVAKAEAALEQARKAAEIVEKELKAAERTAETRLEIARLRLEKFLGQRRSAASANAALVAGTAASPSGPDSGASSGTNEKMVTRLEELLAEDARLPGGGEAGARLRARLLQILGPPESLAFEMGEMASQILQQIDVISLARGDLSLAEQTLHHSRKLSERGFITSNELERDEIAYKRELSTQLVAWNDLLLLINYTLPETLLTLRLEVENSELNLESVLAASGARRVREDAELRSVEAEFLLAREQLETWERQIDAGILRAPTPGLVVYGRMDWDEPVYEGMEVRERQEVILLPDISQMVVDIRVPESQVGKLAEGQRASVQVDAFPNRPFSGRVTRVATLPEPGPRSQVVKVYTATIAIDGGNGGGTLRPGMNGTVTIEVGTLRDVLNVPMTALERKGDEHYVWKLTPQGPTVAWVSLGANNLTHVEIASGLAEGDAVYLVRPPNSLPPGAGQEEEEAAPAPEPEAPTSSARAPR